MSAPSGDLIYSEITRKIEYNSIYYRRFTRALSNEISDKWVSWIPQVRWGSLDVAGAGIGSWYGVGNGGKVDAPPYIIDREIILNNAGWENRRPRGTIKFLDILSDILKNRWATWVSSYKFQADPYVGTTTATVVTAGIFTAKNVPNKLERMGTGTNPSGIAPEWESRLESAPDPIFRLSHPLCRTRVYIRAVASTVEEQFAQFFLINTLGLDNTVVGPSAAMTGAGASVSFMDGIIK